MWVMRPEGFYAMSAKAEVRSGRLLFLDRRWLRLWRWNAPRPLLLSAVFPRLSVCPTCIADCWLPPICQYLPAIDEDWRMKLVDGKKKPGKLEQSAGGLSEKWPCALAVIGLKSSLIPTRVGWLLRDIFGFFNMKMLWKWVHHGGSCQKMINWEISD